MKHKRVAMFVLSADAGGSISSTCGSILRRGAAIVIAAGSLLHVGVAQSSAAAPGQSVSMISIALPSANKIMADGTVEVTIHLNAPADPSTLAVEADDEDITAYFSSCHQAPCDVTAKLNGNVVSSGWNYLDATVEGPNASTDSDSAQFYDDRGISPTDATTGYAPSYAVHISATESNGLEVDYAPGVGNTPTYYPNASHPGCQYGQLALLTLNRTTLAPKSIRCFGTNDNASLNTYLKTLTKSDLVFAEGSKEEPLGRLDLSPIGGTNFTAKDAPRVYAYSIIGYGASPAGLAVESYKTSPYEEWDGVKGDLLNIGSTTPMYGFRPTDSPAFAIQPAPAGGTAKITIGYVTSFPIGEGELPPNFTVPSQFTNVTYTSPACRVTCEGGFFTAVFDAYTLRFLWSNTYATNSASSTAEMARMVADLKFHLTNFGPRIVIITSVGNPLGSTSNVFNATITPSQDLVTTIQDLNVSASAVKLLISGGSFSMIGIPGARPAPDQGNHDITKWYSSSLQEGETGALQGLLQRDNAFRYRPEDVAPFSVDSSVTNPTANDLLSFAIPDQLGTAPSVDWPEMDTVGLRKAYAYASEQMNREDYYSGDACRLPIVQCEDIRSRYTSSQLIGITTGIDPRTIPYPSGNDPGFTTGDLNAVTQQLAREKQYLKNTASYATELRQINTNATMNIGLSLQNSATSVASAIAGVDSSPGKSDLSLVPSILDGVAALTSIIGVPFKPAAVISGLLSTASGILGIIRGAQPEPEDRVTKLANLLAENSGKASEYAFRFNTSVQSSTGMYFNDVYSDWFKLQTTGLMTVTNDSGWYYQTVGNALTEFNNDFVAEARISFFEQVMPQYFNQRWVRKVPAYCFIIKGPTSQHGVDINAISNTVAADLPVENLESAYSWDFWPTAEYPRSEDYVFMVVKKTTKTWPSSLGTTLMGPANFSNPNGNLGIPREFFYDSSGYSVFSNNQFPQACTISPVSQE
jgi:hypothetical protein